MKNLSKFTIKKARYYVMSNKERKKIKVQTFNDVTDLGQISKEKLLEEALKYDKANYNPLDNIEEKEVLHSKNKS